MFIIQNVEKILSINKPNLQIIFVIQGCIDYNNEPSDIIIYIM
jgi:hypothetical protein